jgi:uncharacterized protein (TIRG00374 family)
MNTIMERLKLIVKIFISLGLLVYLVKLAEPAEIIKVLATIREAGGIFYIISAILFFIVAIFVYSIRWQILIKGYNIHISIIRLFKYYLIGLFFNNFLPTSIGGDLIRIYKLIQHSGERTIGFASVLTERLMGFISSLVIALVSIIIMLNQFEDLNLLYIDLGLLFILILFIVFLNHLVYPLNQLLIHIKIFRLGERIMKFFEALRFYRNNKIIFLHVFIVSIMGQVLIILMTYLISLALKLNISISYIFLIVPITFLLTMLPSINGLGVREGGFVFFLGKIGITSAAALSISFISIIIPMMVSILGGILFILSKDKVKIKEMEFVK